MHHTIYPAAALLYSTLAWHLATVLSAKLLVPRLGDPPMLDSDDTVFSAWS
jgi:hypothetical protein